MTWRIPKISGTTSTATWRVANVSGTAGSTWRLANLSGSTSYAPPTAWRVANVSGQIGGRWRVCNVSGSIDTSTTPAVSLAGPTTVDPVWPFTVQATVTNGVAVSSYTWSTSARGIIVSTSADGRTATISCRGLLDGDTVTVSCTATSGSMASAPATLMVAVRKGTLFAVVAGSYVLLSPPYIGLDASGVPLYVLEQDVLG